MPLALAPASTPVQPLLTPALTPKANRNLSLILTITLGENHYNSRNL